MIESTDPECCGEIHHEDYYPHDSPHGMNGEEREAFKSLNFKTLLTLFTLSGMLAVLGGTWFVQVEVVKNLRSDVDDLKQFRRDMISYTAETSANIREIKALLQEFKVEMEKLESR
jgi:hypothetical protein